MLLKALVALVPACLLLAGSAIIFLRRRSLTGFMQLLGSGSLVTVALAHICEALDVLAWMHWGLQHSVGHYLDASAAFLGFLLFPTGYLLGALTRKSD